MKRDDEEFDIADFAAETLIHVVRQIDPGISRVNLGSFKQEDGSYWRVIAYQVDKKKIDVVEKEHHA